MTAQRQAIHAAFGTGTAPAKLESETPPGLERPAQANETHAGHGAWHVVPQRTEPIKTTKQMQRLGVNSDARTAGETNRLDAMPDQLDRRGIQTAGAPMPGSVQLKRWLNSKRRVAVEAQYNQSQAEFKGTESTPVTKAVTVDFVLDLLNAATTNAPVQAAAVAILQMMHDNSWCITAGVHKGGLGGAAGAADPEPHISLNVNGSGYHLRVKEGSFVLWDIAGPNISLTKGREAKESKDNPAPSTQVEDLMSEHKLTQKEALDAVKYIKKNDSTVPEGVAYVKSGKPNLGMRTKKADGTFRTYQYDAAAGLFVLR